MKNESERNRSSKDKFQVDQEVWCDCEDGMHRVTIIKIRANSHKKYKIRFNGFGHQFDSWCEEDCLSFIEEGDSEIQTKSSKNRGKRSTTKSPVTRKTRTSGRAGRSLEYSIDDEKSEDSTPSAASRRIQKNHFLEPSHSDDEKSTLQSKNGKVDRKRSYPTSKTNDRESSDDLSVQDDEEFNDGVILDESSVEDNSDLEYEDVRAEIIDDETGVEEDTIEQPEEIMEEESEDDEEEELVVGGSYMARLVQGDFPVQILQFMKNSNSRVKVHYYGFPSSENSWINVKYLYSLSPEVRESIPSLIAKESGNVEPEKKRVIKRKRRGSTLPQIGDEEENTYSNALENNIKQKNNIKKNINNASKTQVAQSKYDIANELHFGNIKEELWSTSKQASNLKKSRDSTNLLSEGRKSRKRRKLSEELESENKNNISVKDDEDQSNHSQNRRKEGEFHQNTSSQKNICNNPNNDSLSTSTIPRQIMKVENLTWEEKIALAIRSMDRDFEASVSCRQNEIKQIETSLKLSIDNQRGTCIYISGKPGTGKTQTVTEILCRLNIPNVYIDCVGAKSNSIKDCLAIDHKGKNLTPATCPQTVLILDEVEHFLSGDKASKRTIEEIMYWTTIEDCPLIVIGIANKLDFRELPLSDVSRTYVKETVVFLPYTDTELEEIVNSRLRIANAMELFAPRAIKFLCWKIATARGDARSAIDITQKALKYMKENKQTLAFTISDFNRQLPQWLPTNSTATKIESLTQQQKIVLMVILRTQKSFVDVPLTMDRLRNECRRTKHARINLSELNGAINGLMQQNILSTKRGKQGKEEIQLLIDKNMVINYFEGHNGDMYLRIINGE